MSDSVSLLHAFVFFFFSLLLSGTAANAQESYRVLSIHGVWGSRTWDREFDRDLDRHLDTQLGGLVELTSLNLGIDYFERGEEPQAIIDMVKFQIEDKNIDMVISVLPRTIDFIQGIGAAEDVHNLFVLPTEEQLQDVASNSNIWAIESTAIQGIDENFSLILELVPDVTSIELVGGNGVTDLTYRDRARMVAANYSDQIDVNFHSGLTPIELAEFTQSLPSTAVIMALPYAQHGDGVRTSESVLMPILAAREDIPVFAISDVMAELGALGGSLSSTDVYAEAAATTIGNIIYQRANYTQSIRATNSTVLDWVKLQRNNLDPNRLTIPYTLVNRPVQLWEQYPYYALAAVNLFLILVLALLVQQYSLQRIRTANKRIEESERQALEIAERYSLLTMNSLDVIWTWDGRVNALSYCSPSIHLLLGYTTEEFMGMHLTKIMSPESAADAREKIFNKLQDSQVFEAEMIHKDGSSVWVEIAAKQIETDEGNSEEWVGVTRDISKRRQQEKEQELLQKEIRQAQKFESLGSLAGGIAHDFNNILGILMGITDLLKIELAENKRAIELIDKLSKGTSRARGLVSQILTFSRQSSGAKEIAELVPVLEEAIDLISTGVPRNISIIKNFRDDSLKILADPNQVEQVLVNLLTNAYEAIGDEEGEISVSLEAVHVDEEVEFDHGQLVAGDYALIKVKDNGPGLEKDKIDRIFDPFYTSKQLGNGMGLAIVHGIMLEHKGAIHVDNLAEGGLEFSLYFPLSNEDGVAISQKVKSITVAKKSNIMVLDDQDELLKTVTLMLEAMGHNCVPCSDPHKAIDILAKSHGELDLLITDYSMPDISGLDIIEHCRNHYPELNLILTTGYNAELQNEARVGTMELPQILQKPFTLESLSQVVEDSLH